MPPCPCFLSAVPPQRHCYHGVAASLSPGVPPFLLHLRIAPSWLSQVFRRRSPGEEQESSSSAISCPTCSVQLLGALQNSAFCSEGNMSSECRLGDLICTCLPCCACSLCSLYSALPALPVSLELTAGSLPGFAVPHKRCSSPRGRRSWHPAQTLPPLRAFLAPPLLRLCPPLVPCPVHFLRSSDR